MGAPDGSVDLWVDDGPASPTNPVPVSGTVATGGLTDTELRNSPVKVDDDATQAALVALQATIDDGVAVTGPATDAQMRATPLVVGGSIVTKSAEFTRPNDSNPYIALDVVADSTGAPTVLTFADLGRVNNGSGYITKARAMTDKKDVGLVRLRLHLFHTAPTAIGDNSPYLLLYANRANRVGAIDLPAFTTEDPTNSTAAYASLHDLRLPFVCAAADNDLFGILETRDAFTPAAQQQFFIELTADRN